MLRAETLISTTLIGTAVGLGAYAIEPYYGRALDFMERDFGEKLRRMQFPIRSLRRTLIVWTVALGMTFVGTWLFAQSLVFAVLGTAIFLCGPWFLLRRMAEKHRLRIEDQLADAMVSLSSAVKAGLSLAQAMGVLADQSPKPINAEFRRIVGEYELGKPLDKTLEEARDRLKSENFALFAAALLASRESGGRLNETIERIARSIRELQRLERKIQSETAMARRSAVYMAIAPFFILVMYYFIDARAVELLFTTLVGQLLLAAAVVLDLLAYGWARLILNPDI
ncbi:MAG: type II secretion system F family protein [Planctomycetia bacterium]|nr:type II secretion system F family protein [Planctomycetia bacterium]